MGNFYYNLQGGLNTQLTPIMLGADTKKVYWADGYNVEPYKNQGITRQKGNQIVFDISAKIKPKQIIPKSLGIRTIRSNFKQAEPEAVSKDFVPAGITAYPKGSKNFVLALSDGRIFHFTDATGGLNLIYDFDCEISRFVFEYFLDGLVILPESYEDEALDGIYFNPANKPQVDFLNFKNPRGELIAATSVCQYAGRLWISSDSTLYYSALGTYNDWSTAHDAGYISNFHSSTAKIVALCEYGGSLAIYKEFEVFLLSGNDPETFVITKFADKGATSPGSVLTCNNRQYFFNDCGLFSLSLAGELSQIVMSQNRAKNIADFFRKLDIGRLSEVKMLSLELKNQIWIFPPIMGELLKKEVWIYDWELDCWFTRVIPFDITDAATVCGEIYTVTPEGGGRIFVENKGNTFSGKTIKFSVSTPFFNFSKPTVNKIIDEFEIVCGGNSENDFYISLSNDYMSDSATLPERISIYSPETLVWEGEEGVSADTCWADDNFGGIWSEIVQESIQFDIFDTNKSIQLHFMGEKPGQDLTIIGFEFKGIIYDE